MRTVGFIVLLGAVTRVESTKKNIHGQSNTKPKQTKFRVEIFMLIIYALVHLSFHVAACKCNGHANVCQVLTGKCFCTTKGIKGDQCQL